MRNFRSSLMLLVAVVFGMSLVIPAEDLPETPYDESETLPYESNSVFSIILEQSARAAQSALTLAFPRHFHPTTARRNPAQESACIMHRICYSLAVFNRSLRC